MDATLTSREIKDFTRSFQSLGQKLDRAISMMGKPIDISVARETHKEYSTDDVTNKIIRALERGNIKVDDSDLQKYLESLRKKNNDNESVKELERVIEEQKKLADLTKSTMNPLKGAWNMLVRSSIKSIQNQKAKEDKKVYGEIGRPSFKTSQEQAVKKDTSKNEISDIKPSVQKELKDEIAFDSSEIVVPINSILGLVKNIDKNITGLVSITTTNGKEIKEIPVAIIKSQDKSTEDKIESKALEEQKVASIQGIEESLFNLKNADKTVTKEQNPNIPNGSGLGDGLLNSVSSLLSTVSLVPSLITKGAGKLGKSILGAGTGAVKSLSKSIKGGIDVTTQIAKSKIFNEKNKTILKDVTGKAGEKVKSLGGAIQEKTSVLVDKAKSKVPEASNKAGYATGKAGNILKEGFDKLPISEASKTTLKGIGETVKNGTNTVLKRGGKLLLKTGGKIVAPVGALLGGAFALSDYNSAVSDKEKELNKLVEDGSIDEDIKKQSLEKFKKNAQKEHGGKAVGGTVGAVAGGLLGAVLGAPGVAIGSALGGMAGEWVGEKVGNYFKEEADPEILQYQKNNEKRKKERREENNRKYGKKYFENANVVRKGEKVGSFKTAKEAQNYLNQNYKKDKRFGDDFSAIDSNGNLLYGSNVIDQEGYRKRAVIKKDENGNYNLYQMASPEFYKNSKDPWELKKEKDYQEMVRKNEEYDAIQATKANILRDIAPKKENFTGAMINHQAMNEKVKETTPQNTNNTVVANNGGNVMNNTTNISGLSSEKNNDGYRSLLGGFGSDLVPSF